MSRRQQSNHTRSGQYPQMSWPSAEVHHAHLHSFEEILRATCPSQTTPSPFLPVLQIGTSLAPDPADTESRPIPTVRIPRAAGPSQAAATTAEPVGDGASDVATIDFFSFTETGSDTVECGRSEKSKGWSLTSDSSPRSPGSDRPLADPPPPAGTDKRRNRRTSEALPGEKPTDEDLKQLRRVSDKIPFRVFAIAFVELVERMSYYGTVAVFVNFLQQPNPGTPTGKPLHPDEDDAVPGALGLGQEKASVITTFNQFWIYLIPILGAYLADTYYGRFRVIGIALVISILGHTILTTSAIPHVMAQPSHSLGVFIAGLIVMGIGTGCFKPNISPLIAEQVEENGMWINQLPNGERVIVDPALTTSRVYHWFYMFINIGSLIGQVSMVYTERYVGYWAAFLLPTLCFGLAIPILIATRRMYKSPAPKGSVLGKAIRLLLRGSRGRWHLSPIRTYKHMNDGTFWDKVKPSAIHPSDRPAWYVFDDAWVDEVRRGFSACTVFLWYPLYWIAYNQISNNLTSQAATMSLHGIPNDVISNLDPLCTIVLIPLLSSWIYPALEKRGLRFTPIKRIATGFFLASLSMVWACVVQLYIYRLSPCGKLASTCPHHASLSIWTQTGSYIFLSISEILTAITALEYAFNKAPRNMRSLVTSFALFMSAISAALGEAFVPLAQDPYLIWNYGAMAVFSAVASACFWLVFRDLDKKEDELNGLPGGMVDEDPYPSMPSRTDTRLF